MSPAEKALAALEAAGKAATPGPLIQDGRFVEVDRDGDFISEHFAQHNITHGDPVAIGKANAKLHVLAVNLSSPLAAVARAAMAVRISTVANGVVFADYECIGQLFAALDALEAAAEGVV